MRRTLIIGGALALAACTGSGHHAVSARTAQQHAEAACRAAAPHDYFNAQPTTVGEIHAIPGPEKAIRRAYSNVLPRVPASAFAAWCWRQPTPHKYVSYVVGPSGEVMYVNATWEGNPPPKPGPEIPI
jgi:hypothetical protein